MGRLVIATRGGHEDVIIVAGQSNAGDGNSLTSSDLNAHSVTPDTNVKIWNGSAFVTLQNAVNNDILNNSGSTTWGPEVEFAYQWRLANPGKTLYLVKRAIGGTGLDETAFPSCWAPPARTVSGTRYFNLVTSHMTGALAALTNPKVRGILWMQGEADANDTQATADRYQTNLTDFCNATQTYWGDVQTKVIVGRIKNVNGTVWTYGSTVQAAQDAVGVSLSSFVRTVNTDSCSVQAGAAFHYDGPGMVTLGGLMYSAYLT